jgi:uncharacterized membrane protein YdbT with pleckstrin-like domain
MEDAEHTIWTGRPSWRGRLSIFVPGFLLAILVIILARAVSLSWESAFIAFLVVGAVTVVWGLLDTIRWKYTVTNRRVVVRHGLVSVNEQTARLERVQDLTLHQSLFDRLFGVGHLMIDTAGTDGRPLEFRALENPAQAREILDNAVRAEEHEAPAP